MKKFIITTLALIGSRVFDVLTTYWYIPDLKGETNPLVSILGLGWSGALIIQLLVLAGLIYCSYAYHFKTVQVPSFETSIRLTEFISLYHFKAKNKFFQLFYKLPSNPHSLMSSVGGIVPNGLIAFSLLVGTSTTGLILIETYRMVYKQYHIPVFLYLASALLMVYFSIRFYSGEKQRRLIR
ncbi:MAG: hypothetical protein H6608_12355 [Flavobacteriales bacterium]|nr:hypothetical protein [Bacteroidota bacterium]MCB9241923.1 hypothetical protein [Flavobacteriales bacterium]